MRNLKSSVRFFCQNCNEFTIQTVKAVNSNGKSVMYGIICNECGLRSITNDGDLDEHYLVWHEEFTEFINNLIGKIDDMLENLEDD